MLQLDKKPQCEFDSMNILIDLRLSLHPFKYKPHKQATALVSLNPMLCPLRASYIPIEKIIVQIIALHRFASRGLTPNFTTVQVPTPFCMHSYVFI